MSRATRILESLLAALRGRRAPSWVDRDIREEMDAHVALRTEDNIAAGMSPEEARRDAERRFGDRDRILHLGRAERLGQPLLSPPPGAGQGDNPARDLVRDVRFGLRVMARSPAFTAVAVISLALGIGFNTAVFSVVDAMLLRPRQVRDSGRLVRIVRTLPQGPQNTVSYPDLADVAAARSLSGVAGYRNMIVPFNHDGEAEFLFGEGISDNLFQVLGVRPLLGRDFDASENESGGGHAVVMISEELWRSRFGGDPDIVGRDMILGGSPYTIVGVVPHTYDGGTPPVKMHFWVPAAMSDTLESSTSRTGLMERRGTQSMVAVGRLAPGATMEQAGAEVAAIGERLAAEYPDTHGGAGLAALRYDEVRFDPSSDRALLPAAGMLMTVVGMILLIACANVANMMLSRASARRQEMTVRLALGAGRGRLVRQMLTESVLLALVGGVLGVVLADAALRAALALQPPVMVPISFDVGIDGRVLAFTALLACLTGVVFGVLPALRCARQDIGAAMKAAETRHASGAGGSWLRSALVVVQMSVSLVLIIAAGLLLRSLASARSIDPGFATDDIVALTAGLRMQGYTPDEAHDFMQRYMERVAALPGVQRVAFAERMPLESSVHLPAAVWFPDRPVEPGQGPEIVEGASVSPSYFEVFAIPLAAGRPFDDRDLAEAPAVAIVNPAFAARYWPGRSPLGERFSTDGPEGPWIEVVGVSAAHKVRTLGEEPQPYFYRPYAQEVGSGFGTVAVRTAGPPGPILEAMRRELLRLNPNLAVLEAETIGQHLALSLFPVRAAAWSLALLGAIGATLAAIGVYGVVSFSVSRRTHEIGIRMAVGADRGNVVGMVVRQGLRLAVIGLLVGVGASLLLTRGLGALLYGVGATDPIAFGGAALLLLAVALLANLIPARRAAAVDPVAALRSE